MAARGKRVEAIKRPYAGVVEAIDETDSARASTAEHVRSQAATVELERRKGRVP